ncbi:MAG: hypothetical protein A2161_12275 [Candidatus Schekmanbacteria bacterium RBG_13_48_7]|uniref:NarG-like domain-containing protein n=1 Tax=Candidatus Schekmanbacteria bacterium RBG_13_48_7 TaxID=1817878 RepID=A0A1F7RUA6_9BACT|nr:MAG: hypothetical protein A2161_12275 [Candidatus Schekmanbacteria bacterium RBG_13_48_7]
MEQWVEWARGPVFRTVFIIMVLGLIRVFILNIINIIKAVSKANNKKIPYRVIALNTLKWIFPTTKVFGSRAFFSITSVLFHISIIITPIFLSAHIMLWDRGLGISWPSIGMGVSDFLTILAIVTSIALFIQRVSARASRALSRPQDYILPLLISIPFISGYLAMHPAMNPFNYFTTMFVHVMSGNLVIFLIPFSKLAHLVLLPSNQLVSEVGWHFVLDGPQKVTKTLGKEGIPV